MNKIDNLVLDLRSVYACDPNRPGAHFIRRHRIRLLREDPTKRGEVLIGTAVVEVAQVEEFIYKPNGFDSRAFEADGEWMTIHNALMDNGAYSGTTLHEHPALQFKPNIAFLRYIRIQPESRGSGYGRIFVSLLKKHFRSSCGVLIAYSLGAPKATGLAHPLLPDSWEKEEPYPESRLLKGLQQAGFQPIEGSELYLTDLQEDE